MSKASATRVSKLSERLRMALLSVAMLAIVLASLGAAVLGSHVLHHQMRQHLRALAVLTASQSEAALLFQDRAAAEQVLQAIPRGEGVTVAELRNEAGGLVARVSRPESVSAGWLGALVRDSAAADVVVDGRRIGSVALENGGEPLVRGLASLLLLDFLGSVVVGCVVIIIARRLTRRITEPLTELTTVIREVRDTRDFGRRAPPFSIAEIEALRTDFHALLTEIQRRDQDLARTHAALKRLALHDTLTGLPNRAMFEQAVLDALGGDAARERRAGLLYFDIDSFKSVNDTLGHAVGDDVLVGIAARLKRSLPDYALPARIGGDEFVVLVAPPHADETRRLAHELQDAIQAPMHIGNHVFHPGVSVGYAVSQPASASADELLHLADQAMYWSKDKRRLAGIRTRWEAHDGRGRDTKRAGAVSLASAQAIAVPAAPHCPEPLRAQGKVMSAFATMIDSESFDGNDKPF
jgi:diguanylate cyclase (GGDEF)-like protein